MSRGVRPTDRATQFRSARGFVLVLPGATMHPGRRREGPHDEGDPQPARRRRPAPRTATPLHRTRARRRTARSSRRGPPVPPRRRPGPGRSPRSANSSRRPRSTRRGSRRISPPRTSATVTQLPLSPRPYAGSGRSPTSGRFGVEAGRGFTRGEKVYSALSKGSGDDGCTTVPRMVNVRGTSLIGPPCGPFALQHQSGDRSIRATFSSGRTSKNFKNDDRRMRA